MRNPPGGACRCSFAGCRATDNPSTHTVPAGASLRTSRVGRWNIFRHSTCTEVTEWSPHARWNIIFPDLEPAAMSNGATRLSRQPGSPQRFVLIVIRTNFPQMKTSQRQPDNLIFELRVCNLPRRYQAEKFFLFEKILSKMRTVRVVSSLSRPPPCKARQQHRAWKRRRARGER